MGFAEGWSHEIPNLLHYEDIFKGTLLLEFDEMMMGNERRAAQSDKPSQNHQNQQFLCSGSLFWFHGAQWKLSWSPLVSVSSLISLLCFQLHYAAVNT